MIKTKSSNVRLVGLTAGLAWILYALEEFHRSSTLAMPEHLIITSINDGVHSPNSRHYTNEAIDIRSHNFSSREAKRAFRQSFEEFLNYHPILTSYIPIRNNKFRILFENVGKTNEHFHVQVLKGESYP